MPERHVLRALVVLAAGSWLLAAIARAIVLFRPGGSDAPIGGFLFSAAIVAMALTPVQVAVLWLVLRDPIRSAMQRRRHARLVDEVLRAGAFRTALQPIIDIRTRRVVGVEALTRFPEDIGWSPDAWFRAAHEVGRGEDLEEATLRRALAAARLLPDGFLSLNVSPSVLASPMLLRVLDISGVAQRRIIVELTEHQSVTDYARLIEARQELRKRGIRFAVDDAGAGYASLKHLVTLDPDMIKIDRSLVTGLAKDPIRRAMLEAVVSFGHHQGATVVAEGVESAQELEALARLGVDLAQGFFIAYPTADQVEWIRWLDPAYRQVTDTFDAVYVIPQPS